MEQFDKKLKFSKNILFLFKIIFAKPQKKNGYQINIEVFLFSSDNLIFLYALHSLNRL